MGRPLYTTVLNLNNPSKGGKSTTFFYNPFNQVTKAIFIKLGVELTYISPSMNLGLG